MSQQQIDENQSRKLDNHIEDKMEIDLMEILRKTISIRKVLYKAVGVGLVIGIIVSLSIPKQYTVKVTLSPEMGNSKGNNGLAGIAASFLGSGGMVGETTDALNASLSADIVSSTPFLLELFEMEIFESNSDGKIILASYLDEQSYPWWNYVIGLPSMLINGAKSLLENAGPFTDKNEQGTIELSKKEYKNLKFLRKNIIASVDKKTAITSISVTLQNPRVTAVVADSVVRKLQKYIINYRTSKAKEDCLYLEKLFKERQKEYYVIQRKYAEYVDTHDNLILQSVRAEQERLQNDMNLAYQVYSQVANQLQVARAKVQEEKPVFAVVEPAVVPLKASGIGMKNYIFMFVVLSVIFTICWKLFGVRVLNGLKKEVKCKS